MNKKYMFIASLLLSSTCLASSLIEDDSNDMQSTQLFPFSQNTVYSPDDEFTNLISNFFTERMAITCSSHDIDKSVHIINSAHQIEPKNLQGEDWIFFTDLLKQTFHNARARCQKTGLISANPVTAEDIKNFTDSYWDLFQNLRTYSSKKDVKYFNTNTPKGQKNLDSVLESLIQFTTIYEAFLRITREEANSDIEKFTKYKDLQKCDAIVHATWKVFMDAYHKFNHSTDDVIGPLLGVNNIYMRFGTDNNYKFLYYIKYDGHIRPFMVYSHMHMFQDIYKAYIPYADFQNTNKPILMPLFKFNKDGIPEFNDRAGIVIQRTDFGYTINIYYGKQGIKSYPYAKSKDLALIMPAISTGSSSMTNDENENIRIEAENILCDLLKNNNQDSIINSLTSKIDLINEDVFKNRIHAVAEMNGASEKAEEFVESLCDSAQNLDMVKINPHTRQIMNIFAANALNGKNFAFLELPNNRYEIQIQQVQFELTEILLLKQQYIQIIQDYREELKLNSTAHNMIEPAIITSESTILNADNIQEHQTIFSKIDEVTKTLEDNLQHLGQEQAKYEAKIAREQQDVSKRVMNDADGQQNKSKQVQNRSSKNLGKQNRQNNKHSTRISSSSSTSANNNNQELKEQQFAKAKMEKLIKDIHNNPQKSMNNLKFMRILNQLSKVSNLVGDNVKVRLNKGSHGKITLLSSDGSDSSTKTQNIGVVRSHGSAKDNTVSNAQVRNMNELLIETLRTNIKKLSKKIAELKNAHLNIISAEKISQDPNFN